MSDFRIRRYADADADGVAQVFFDAVHIGTRDHYTADQRRAWAGEAPQPARWREKLAPMTAYVAERQGRVVGIMTIDEEGLIDLAFVAPDMAGAGIGWALYQTIEAAAREMGVARLHADVSHAARPFFERQGFRMVRRQEVERAGITLTNQRMEKALAPRR
ncbi:GNAT family N-acetyltransferase [Rhodobacteraceae bacterium NNCM2]|nr:GNAT family N-acetyltransferase [Coraliihabitans acroporae]